MAALLADQLRAVAAFPYGGSSSRRRRGRGLQGAPAKTSTGNATKYAHTTGMPQVWKK